ncbi:DUF3967 domain-containing protein [Cytobacillus firmus]|uniref:DNA-binding protein Ptr n=1 Tax=Cytobacillus firmus DS1 TaxID=1307436 RepID=W7KQH6_CYTFI|nr:DUF3967 domain-containing protein [Cytobacillus firmus]EWG08398.1 DNA-binding protein Ptr [Cytobacillus firmus DS1]
MKEDIKTFSTKEVAKRLLIEPVTVRKYTQMLEEKGYLFKKDDRGWRLFIEEDIKALEYLAYLKMNGSSLEDAIEHVANLYRSNLSISQPNMTLQKDDPLEDFIKRQEAFNEALLKRLEEQQQYIDKVLQKRDEVLLNALKETLETKKLIAAEVEKKKWWQFWK